MHNAYMQAQRDHMCYVRNPRRDHMHMCHSRRDLYSVIR